VLPTLKDTSYATGSAARVAQSISSIASARFCPSGSRGRQIRSEGCFEPPGAGSNGRKSSMQDETTDVKTLMEMALQQTRDGWIDQWFEDLEDQLAQVPRECRQEITAATAIPEPNRVSQRGPLIAALHVTYSNASIASAKLCRSGFTYRQMYRSERCPDASLAYWTTFSSASLRRNVCRSTCGDILRCSLARRWAFA